MDLPHAIAELQADALPPKPPGGKALKRLEEFLLERDMTEAGAALGLHTETGEGGRRAEPGEGRKRAETARARAAHAEAMDLAEAEQEALAMLTAPGPAPLLGPVWRPLGPGEIPGGQTYGASRVTVPGRVAAIAIDPSNRNHALVGAAAGGVWESFDGGTTWAARGDAFPTLTTGAIAFDPTHHNVVYCGTGEGNWYGRWGQGVMRSTDGGTFWTLHSGAPFIGQGFHDLLVDPANSNNLVAATTGGVYTSADAGVTWTQRRTHRCWSLAMAPGEILAACDDGLQRSTNGGSTWAAVALPGAPAGWSRLAVAICRATPSFASLSAPPVPPPTSPHAIPAAPGTRWRHLRGYPPVRPGTTGTWRCSRTTPIPFISAPSTFIAAITPRAGGPGPISAPRPPQGPIRFTPISTRSPSIRSIRT
jgi:hypothetical protein